MYYHVAHFFVFFFVKYTMKYTFYCYAMIIQSILKGFSIILSSLKIVSHSERKGCTAHALAVSLLT